MIIECPACNKIKTQDDINKEFLIYKKQKKQTKSKPKDIKHKECLYCLGHGYITVF